MLNLDTHIAIYALSGGLTAGEERALERDAWGVSAIVLWEVTRLLRHGKLRFTPARADAILADLNSLHVWPITLDVCRAIDLLDFRSDPADELIAATSVLLGFPLVTRDVNILSSRVVPLVRT